MSGIDSQTKKLLSNKVIETIDMSKSYFLGKEEVKVLHDISLDVKVGDFLAIMGPSGSGKSTLLNIIGCLDKPDAGSYKLNSTTIGTRTQSQLADIRNKEIGFVFQNFNLLPKLDVFSNVELPLIYANVEKRKRIEKVEKQLKNFGIWERRNHKPNEISGGQKQRVAIARALVKEPTLILADEPTGNLDSHTTEEILEVFDELHRQGNTIVIITHEKEVAQRAKRVLNLVDGYLSE